MVSKKKKKKRYICINVFGVIHWEIKFFKSLKIQCSQANYIQQSQPQVSILKQMDKTCKTFCSDLMYVGAERLWSILIRVMPFKKILLL